MAIWQLELPKPMPDASLNPYTTMAMLVMRMNHMGGCPVEIADLDIAGQLLTERNSRDKF
jgi:hypothetical protein